MVSGSHICKSAGQAHCRHRWHTRCPSTGSVPGSSVVSFGIVSGGFRRLWCCDGGQVLKALISRRGGTILHLVTAAVLVALVHKAISILEVGGVPWFLAFC